jgi:hypothetical protein
MDHSQLASPAGNPATLQLSGWSEMVSGALGRFREAERLRERYVLGSGLSPLSNLLGRPPGPDLSPGV